MRKDDKLHGDNDSEMIKLFIQIQMILGLNLLRFSK